MKVHVYKDAETAGKAAGLLFAAQIIRKPASVLGFATGSTPLPAYQTLVNLYEAGVLDFSNIRTFNLDEYAGIDRSHSQSYYRFMFDNLFSKVNIPPESVRVPNPAATSLEAECAEYDAAIDAAGGIDLQILGIGNNGHIAFNEPGSFPFGTHIVELTPSTIEANKRFFDSADDVPRKAISMGIGSIMKAREIVMLITGANKAPAAAAMINGPVDSACPASILQMHPNVTVLLDSAAAAML